MICIIDCIVLLLSDDAVMNCGKKFQLKYKNIFLEVQSIVLWPVGNVLSYKDI